MEEGTLAAVAGRVRWWHVCLAAGAGLSMLTFIGWASEQWGGEGGSRNHVQRISGTRRPRRGGGGGGGGGRWKKKKRAGRSKKTPESKVARIKQEVKQVLTWMEKMERLWPSLPALDEVAMLVSSVEDGGAKEASEEIVQDGVGVLVRRACVNTFEEEWTPAKTASDPKRQRVETALVTFARDDERQRTAFSRSLSSFERYAVYETSERLGLTHRKVGDAIVVSKLKFELPTIGNDGTKGDEHEDGSEEALAEVVEHAKEEEEGEKAKEELPGEKEARSVSLERCKILEECLTMVLLDLDTLVEREDVVPRAERKSLVSACQQLLAALDAWNAHLQQEN